MCVVCFGYQGVPTLLTVLRIHLKSVCFLSFPSFPQGFWFNPLLFKYKFARVVHPMWPGLEENWIKVREIQRLLPQKVEGLYTIGSITKSLDD